MSGSLMFDDIIVNILRNKKLECHDEEDDFFLQSLIKKVFICTWDHFKTFTGIKEHTSV